MDEQYKTSCEQSVEAIRQDYYNHQQPFKGAPAAIPAIPVDGEGNQTVTGEDVPYQYAELRMPDGKNILAVLMKDIEVKNGPGLKYRALNRAAG